MKVVKGYIGLCDWIEKIIKVFSVLILSFIVIIVFAEVVARYVFNSSFKVTEEMVLFCMPWMAFVGGAIALRGNSLVSINALNRLPDAAKVVIALVANVIVFVFLVYVTQSGVVYVVRNVAQLSTALRVSMAIPYLSVPVGCGAMVIFTLELLLKILFKNALEGEGGLHAG